MPPRRIKEGHLIAVISMMQVENRLAVAMIRPGDHAVVPSDAYGGTYRYYNKIAKPQGVEHSIADMGDVDAVRAAIRPGQTKLVWVETPSNPLLGIADIAAIADVAHEAGALLVVDNTFATSYLQQPLSLGADIVTHSTTKYAGGHSDVVGGAVVTAKSTPISEYADLADRIAFHQNAIGASRDRLTRGSRCAA